MSFLLPAVIIHYTDYKSRPSAASDLLADSWSAMGSSSLREVRCDWDLLLLAELLLCSTLI